MTTFKLPSPADLRRRFPLIRQSQVLEQRQKILDILRGADSRLLLIVGPCSIHDPAAGLRYAEWLSALATDIRDRAVIMMRCYVEKSRTGAGWRGLAREPQPGKPADTAEGLGLSRQFMLAVSDLGLPVATEMVNPLLWSYWTDCISWVSVGARGVESQALREAAAALPCPCGFKNAMNGTADSALIAAMTAGLPSTALILDDDGQIGEAETAGNCLPHLILRGSKQGSNIGQARDICHQIRDKRLPDCLIIDASHGNSAYIPENQAVAAEQALELRKNGLPIRGLMLESYLESGNQALIYGQIRPELSITDPCLGQTATEKLIRLIIRNLGA